MCMEVERELIFKRKQAEIDGKDFSDKPKQHNICKTVCFTDKLPFNHVPYSVVTFPTASTTIEANTNCSVVRVTAKIITYLNYLSQDKLDWLTQARALNSVSFGTTLPYCCISY